MSPKTMKVKATGKKIHKRLNHVPSHCFENAWNPVRHPSPVENGRNPQTTVRITGREGPRSIASSHCERPFSPVGMAIPVHIGKRTPNSSNVRYNPLGYARQRPRNLNLDANDSNLARSVNMVHQVLGSSYQLDAQVQYLSESYVPYSAPPPNPSMYSCSQADHLESLNPHSGAQRHWSSDVGPIFPNYYAAPANSLASVQLPEARLAPTHNQTPPPASYPFNDPSLHLPNDYHSMSPHNPPYEPSGATSSPPLAVPDQDTLPVDPNWSYIF
ncbi:hypothetical protein M413DRAFT_368625 [Hebeloma cylindrosporum]|uniref:Uncharacterized protein n=1 Tax=Hebeloma cylindrosporum TaxID=76867 RepID=A0A0C3BEG7_HEBCY|nr:hypothetical protein M413DRAFT_368625 [Hebeloma cylindrosporum h7]